MRHWNLIRVIFGYFIRCQIFTIKNRLLLFIIIPQRKKNDSGQEVLLLSSQYNTLLLSLLSQLECFFKRCAAALKVSLLKRLGIANDNLISKCRYVFREREHCLQPFKTNWEPLKQGHPPSMGKETFLILPQVSAASNFPAQYCEVAAICCSQYGISD